MKSSFRWLALAALAAAPALADTATTSTTTRKTTIQTPDGRAVTFTGTVVEYVPSKTIVLRDSNQKLVTYTLTPELTIPTDVQVGRTVTVQANAAASGTGAATVEKVTTTSMTPDGDLKTTTRTTATSASGNTTTTEVTRTEGVISAYVPTKTVTIQQPDGTSVTYQLQAGAVVPGDLVVGKRVAIQLSEAGQPRIVRHITYVTTTR